MAKAVYGLPDLVIRNKFVRARPTSCVSCSHKAYRSINYIILRRPQPAHLKHSVVSLD